MSRNPDFDVDAVMSAALETFWRRGYNRSSMQLLLEATGLNRGSFYNSFGAKEAVFRGTLDLYFKRLTSLVVALLDESPHPVQGILNVFELTIITLPEVVRRKGCLLVNTVAELSETDPALAGHALTLLEHVREALVRALKRARAAGLSAHPDAEPRLLAELLFNYMNGLRVTARLEMNPAQIRDSMRQTLRLLGLSLEEAPA